MYTITLLLGKIQCDVLIKAPYLSNQKWDVTHHTNMQHELHIALCGEGKLEVGGREYVIERGEAMLVSQNTYHSPISLSEDFRHFVVAFTPYKQGKSISLESTKICLSEGDIDLCNSIISELKCDGKFWRQRVFALYSLLLTSLFASLEPFSNEPSYTKSDNYDNRFSVIDDFFEVNLKNCTEQMLAQRLHISSRQLNRVLQTNYGTSFRQKLHDARMNRAMWLLRTSEKSISEICEIIGYTEPSFYKAFKNHNGTTPNKYRKEISK